DRARPQEPLGTGHPRPRDARRDRRPGPRGTESARRGRQVSSAGNGRSLTANATMSSNDPLEIALRELESLEQLGIAALVAASSPEALETARIEYLGQKQGKLKAAQERLRTLDPAGKRVYGQRFNGVKQSLEAALSEARLRRHNALKADTGVYESVGSPLRIDVTLPGAIPRLGH